MKRAPPSKKERCSALGLCLEMSPVFDFGQGLCSLRNRRLKVLNGRKKEVTGEIRAREIREGRESYLSPRVSPSHAPVLSCGIGNLQKKSCCTYARAELLFCLLIFLLCLICSRNKAEEDDSPSHFIIIIDMLQGGKCMFFSCHVMSVQMSLRGSVAGILVIRVL